MRIVPHRILKVSSHSRLTMASSSNVVCLHSALCRRLVLCGRDRQRRRTAGRHNKGCATTHTRRRLPVELAYFESHEDRAVCLKRERQIKGWTRAKKEALIAGDAAALKKL